MSTSIADRIVIRHTDQTHLRPTATRLPFALWSFGVSLLIAAALLWPLPLRLHSHTIDTGDALHLAWVVRWAQAGLLGDAPPFSAPAGYPGATPLLFNPPLYALAGLGLPLHLLGWPAHAVYNALTLLSFALALWAVALLGKQASGSAAAGLIAGIGFAFSDVRLAHLAHLNLLSGFWTALLLALLVRAWRRPPQTRRGRMLLAVCAAFLAAAQALSDIYNALYMVVAVCIVGAAWCGALALHTLRRRPRPVGSVGALGALALGGVLALALVAPVLLPTLAAWHALDVARPWADHVRYAAALEHYVMPVHKRALYDLAPLQPDGLHADPTEQRLWPGAVTLGLALLGLFAGRGRLRWVFAAISLTALLLSFGPHLTIGATTIDLPYYAWLFDHVPLFSAARVPARWALLGQLGLAVLSAFGVVRLLGMVGRPAMPGVLLRIGLLTLIALDGRAAHLPSTTDLVGETTPAVYQELAALPEGAVLEWPLENASPTLAHRYQYYTLIHGKPLVNSAGSAPSQHYQDLIATLRSFPQHAALRLLHDLDVRYVVINRWEIGAWSALEPHLAAAHGLQLIGVYEDGRHYLYELEPLPAAPPPLAALSATEHGARLDLQLTAPLWIGRVGDLYRGATLAPIGVRYTDGTVRWAMHALPSVLLPGARQLHLPLPAERAAAVIIGEHTLPLTTLPGGVNAEPTPHLLPGPLPRTVLPGETLPCLARVAGAMADGLVLATTLVDGAWREHAKHDYHLQSGNGPLPCTLALPNHLPPGTYFMALGLYNPQSGAFIPIIGADGVASPGLWRNPQPISVPEPTGRV